MFRSPFFSGKFFLILFLLLPFSYDIFSQGTWVAKSGFGGVTRIGAIGFSIGTKGYLGLGAPTYAAGYNDFWEYDPATNVWTQKANFPAQTRMAAVAWSIGTKGYVAGGSQGHSQATNDLWEYDPSTNSWAQKANYTPGNRTFAGGFAVGTNGYVFGGSDLSVEYNDLWEWNSISNSWAQKAILPAAARRYTGGVSIGSKGYVGGGYTFTNGSYFNDWWEYDPTANSWTQKANLPAAIRMEYSAFSICNYGYVGIGTNAIGSSTAEWWKFDPVANSWAQMANFGGGTRERAVGFSIDQKGYVGTGWCGDGNTCGPQNDFWEFTPPSLCCTGDTLVTQGTMLCAGSSTTLTVVSGGSTSYSWSTGATTSSIVVSPTVTTTYSVVGNGMCGPDANSVTVFVGAQVTPSVSGNSSICSGSTATLNASGGASFSWNTGATTSTVVVAPSFTTTYSVTVSNGACASTVSHTVNVSPTPMIVPGVPSICIGDSTQLNTLFQLGCGVHGSICSGATTASQIGTATTFTNASSTTPFAAVSNSAKFQYLYKASELIASGINQPIIFKEIGFNIQALFGMNPYQNFTIKMGCTQVDSLSSAYIPGLVTVYTPKNATLANGVNYFVLDNPYDWDGSTNIVVEICFYNPTASLSSYVYYSTTSFPSVTYTSGPGVCANSSGLTGANRPNTYFKHCVSNAGNGFDFQWTPSSSLNNDTIPNPIASPTTTTTYTVTVTDNITACITTDTFTVLVGTPFTLSSSPDTMICQSSGIQINTTPSGGNGSYTYSWTPTSSLNNPAISNPVASPIGTTTYIVTATNNGCVATDTVVVNVPYLYNFFVSPVSDSICLGQSVPLTGLLQNVCGVHTSTCSSTSTGQVGTDATTSSANNVTTFVGAFNSSRFQYLYTAAELNAAGIVGASTITQFGLNISAVTGNNIYQNFTVKMGCTGLSALTANFITGLQTVYNTKPLVISNGMNYLVLDNTYDWDGISNIVLEICFSNASTSPNSSVFYSTQGFQSGLYYSANTSACANATGTTVNTRPNSYFRYCAGQGLGSLVYSWIPSSGLSDDSISNPTATPTAPTTYTLTAIDTITGCIFSDSAFINTDSVFAVASTNGIINCTTSGVQLNASASPAGTYSFAWSPATALTNTTSANPTASPSVTTTYTVVVTSQGGCSVSDTVTVTVNVPGLYSFSVIPSIDTICSGSSITLNTIFQRGCGTNSSVCGGPVSTGQIGSAATSTTASGTTPFAGSFTSQKVQYLYRASELAAAGMTQPVTITQLGFNIQSIIGSNSYQNFIIKMKCTVTNTLTTTYESGLATVYTAKPTAIFNGMNYFTFDNPYDWDGTSNLVIEICYGNSVASSNSSVFYSNSGYNSVIYSTGASICGNLTGSNSVNRPNTYFRHCGASGGSALDYLWSPSSSLSSDSVPNPIASPTATTTYTLVATDTASGCIMTDTSMIVVLGINSATVDLGNDTVLCTGNNVTLNAGMGFSSYLWSTGATTSTIIVSSPGGNYWVVGNNMCGSDNDTVAINYYPANSLSLGPNMTICTGNSATLTATATGFTNYLWSTGATASSIVVNTPGNYWVSSNNVCGSASDTVNISLMNPPVTNIGNDSILCVGNSLTLNAGSGFTSYLWSTGGTSASLVVSTGGTYWVTVGNMCGTFTDSVDINYYPANSLSLGPDVSICSGSNTTLTVTATGFTNYLWSTGATTSSIVTGTAGTYWVSSSNVCGTGSDTLVISTVNLPVTDLGSDSILCVGNTVTLDAGAGYGYLWSTGGTNQTISVSTGGTYWTTVSNACGSYTDSININYYPVNSLSLGNDTMICSGDSVLLSVLYSGFTNFVWNTGASTTSITVNQPGPYWVSSANICGSASDTIVVSVINFPTVSLGNDTVICTPTVLYASSTNSNGYIWNTGATTDSILITQAGTYWVSVANACGSDADTLVVSQGVGPVFSLGADTLLCSTITVNIDLSGVGTGYLWQDNSTLPTYTISTAGIYWVTVTNAAGCANTDSILVVFENPPSVMAGNDTLICKGDIVELSAISSGGYLWNTGATTSVITATSDGIYVVYTSNSCGSASDSVRLTTEQCACNLDLPNAFSPNDDGINDIFYVRGSCDDFILRIYDRWGEKVFETTDVTFGWDGKLKGQKMNSGIFNYYLLIRPEKSDKEVKKGNLSLIR